MDARQMNEEQNELEIPRTRGRVKQEQAAAPVSEQPYMTVKLFVRKHLNGDAFWNPNGDALAAPQDVEPGVAVTLKAHRARELIAKGAAVAV